MITREDFMVSVYDYNKDAEDAEKAEKAAAGSSVSAQGHIAPLAERCLSDRNDSWTSRSGCVNACSLLHG